MTSTPNNTAAADALTLRIQQVEALLLVLSEEGSGRHGRTVEILQVMAAELAGSLMPLAMAALADKIGGAA